jgi:hypothetical protein
MTETSAPKAIPAIPAMPIPTAEFEKEPTNLAELSDQVGFFISKLEQFPQQGLALSYLNRTKKSLDSLRLQIEAQIDIILNEFRLHVE